MKLKKQIIYLTVASLFFPIMTIAATTTTTTNTVISAPSKVLSGDNQDSPLKVTISAFLVSKNKEGKDVLTAAHEIAPGDTIEYQSIYDNKGDMPVNHLIILQNIPDGSVYVAHSSVSPVKGTFEATIDKGKTWHTPPLYKEMINSKGQKEKVKVNPVEYQSVRWLLKDPLSKNKSLTFSYRVQIKNGVGR